MTIKTADRNFYVISVYEKTDDYEVSICVDINDESNQKYLITEIKNSEIAYKIMPIIIRENNNKAFKDFQGCFASNGSFFIMFLYHEGKSIDLQFAENTLGLEERLKIVNNLLEHLVLSNAPYYFVYEVLNQKKLVLYDNLDIDFNYYLSNMALYTKISLQDVEKNISKLIEEIFSKEIKNKVSVPLDNYIKNLKSGKIKGGYIEVYKNYTDVYDDLKSKVGTDYLKTQNFLYKIWNKIKALFKLIKPVLMILIILLALAWLIYSFFFESQNKDKSEYTTYQNIGDLIIDEYKEMNPPVSKDE